VTFQGTLVPVPELGPARRAEMRDLMERHYRGVRERDFEADLAEKDYAVITLDGAGAVRGFSTLRVYRTRAAGAERTVLFSGDTIVDAEARSSPIPVRTWLRAALDLAEDAGGSLDWFLLSSGHRTYRVLATLLARHHPCPGASQPELARRLDAYARERYGERYDPERGIVRLARSVHRLRPGVGDVTPARLRDPAVALFAARNPGHGEGDELCCLGEISPGNLTAAGRRLLGAG
jgi:hypothetical protein